MTVGYRTLLQLFETRSVTLDADGVGWVRGLGPFTQFERWKIHSMQTVCNSDAETELIVYRGNTNSAIAGSYSGNFDSNDTQFSLMPGESLSFKWSKGTPGAVASITLDGDRTLRGKLAY